MEKNHVTIRELQLRLLEIIDYVDYVCRKNEIEYFLIGGSALGAIRHKGFIPWDDDFDIAMTWENYSKFCEICKKELDREKFYFQEEVSEHWPLYFSKIKMNNTIFREIDADPNQHHGIFVDIFCLDSVSDNKFMAKVQYIASKILIAQSLAQRGYKSATKLKKVIMYICDSYFFRKMQPYLIKIVRINNKKMTKRVGLFFGIVTYKTCIFPRKYLGKGKVVEFEERRLPVPEMIDEYLSTYFGDYMELPPIEKRVGHLPQEIKL